VKRPLVLAAASLLCLGLLGCAPDDDAALTVNGDDILTVGTLTEELDQMQAANEFLVASDARGEGGNLRSGFVGVVLSNHVFNALLAEQLAAEGGEVTEADVEEGTALLTDQLANPPEGVAPLTLEQVPPDYRQTLIDLYSNFVALVGVLDDDPQAAQDLLVESRLAAEVEVAERYGRWDAEQGNVVPPEGPVTPTTAPLTAPVGG
jgi:hypothetical protein